MGIEEIFSHKDEEIIEIAKHRDLTSEELLRLKSRTYYPAIKLLHYSKGPSESPKEPYVIIAYNIFRAVDECEDVSIKRDTGKSELDIKNERLSMLTRIAYVVGETVKRGYINGKGVEDIIRGDDFRSVTNWLIENEPDIAGKIFAEHFGRGAVLRDLHKITQEGEVGDRIKKALDYSVKSMATGMKIFIEKGPIETFNQLDTYCDHVAGTGVGRYFLNELVRIKDKYSDGNEVKLNDWLAERLGKYLQLTNILKNIRTDYEEGRKFLPGEWIHKGISYEFMMNGNTVDAHDVRKYVFNKITLVAHTRFYNSVEYIKSIPNELSGYKAFCLFPVILAQKTIENMRRASVESVFKGEREAIKITYGIGKVLEFVHGLTTFEEGKSCNSWLDEYRKNPNNFSFKPVEYEMWAERLFKK